MKITEIAVRRPVFTVIVYVAVTVFGLFALNRLPIDLYPEFENPIITVVTLYPGASSWDVEEKVTKPMEKGLGILPGLKEITSRSSEGVSAVFLTFQYSTKLDEAANDVRNGIDFVKQSLPDDLDSPMLFKFNTSFFPIYFGAVVSDEADLTKEKVWLDDHVVQALQALPGVGSVSLWGVAAEEVHVDVKLDEIEKRSLTLTQITQALQAANVSLPAGKLKDPNFDLPVRVPAEFKTIDEIRDVIVGAWQGQPVHLRDVAEVADGTREMTNVATWSGKSVAVFMVQKQSGGNTVDVARAVQARLDELGPQLGRGIEFVKIYDGSDFIQSLIDNLWGSLIAGGLLVIAVVILFLRRFRLSLIVAMSIPGSMIIAFLLIYLQGYTLNVVSLMAMILAIGMVVDNSIVVLENINRHLDYGESSAHASIIGTREVGLAISASTLTTVGVFLPLIFVKGLVSILFGQLAFVIVVTLVASLVTSIFLTPMMTAWMLRSHAQKFGDARKRVNWLDRMDTGYSRLIHWSLDRRLRIYGIALVLLAVSGVAAMRVGFDFLPQFDSGEIRVTLELPVGTSLARTTTVSEDMARRLMVIPEAQSYYVQCGEEEGGWGAVMGQAQGSHIITLTLRLSSVETGRRRVEKVAEDVRKIVATFDGLVAHDVSFGDQGPGQLAGSKPLIVEILGNDYARMKEAAYEVEALVKSIEGTRDVVAEVPYEKPEVQVALDRRRMALVGSTAFQASDTVRTAVYGSTVTRFRGGGKDLDIVVRLQEADRQSLSQVGRVPVPSITGVPMPLRNFAEIASGFSPISIDHSSQRRVLRVGANLGGSSLGEATATYDALSAPIREKYSDLVFRYGGQAKEQRENFVDMMMMLLLGIVLTYLIMAAQFESFMDPLVIMFSVPFAFTGTFLALALRGENFNVLAFLGAIMLVGIVVNNAIVLVDYVNFMRREGTPLIEAVIETSRRRLRPILMTTITTLFGIIPLAVASGEGSELWRPIGVTMLGGLSLSTGVTLILVPCLYVTFERFRSKTRFDKDRMMADAETTVAPGETGV